VSSTIPNGTLSGDAMADLRHELRTPVNHIVGYAEMLLEDLPAHAPIDHREALDSILAAAREVLDTISQTLSTTRTEITPEEIAALYSALQAPRQRVVRATDQLLAAKETTSEFGDDVRRIRKAADRLSVPASEPTQPTQAVETPVTPTLQGEGQERPRILVVDDDEDNREVLRRRLEREGYDVQCASDGLEALERIQQEAFDLVLLDVLMPGADGYQVLGFLKEDDKTRDLPVIMVSALDDLKSVVRCIEQGAEDYLTKPFDPVLLRARVSACLEKKRLRDVELEYLERVRRVIDAATAMESGTYQPGSLGDLAQSASELGRLARVFDGMAANVQQRERDLKDRVRDLRREIEVARATPTAVQALADGASLSTGQDFGGRYEILGAVGQGGMGSVYRARDKELDEEVAIKTLKPQFVTDATLVERFKQEIRLARRLSHRNIVRTHDFGQWRGVYYLTMEYVEGITVRDLLDTRGKLGISAALAVAGQLADALSVAHAQGIVHRDIKPQNLLLDDEGSLKVMDFGVARLAERTSTLTEAGLVVGTPSYMPPEQLLGEKVDARSDLFAVGVVLYECLTGSLPFEAQSPISLIAKLLHEEPLIPSSLNDEVSPALSQLVLCLLAKTPEDRVQTAAELGDQLRRLQ